MYIEDFDHNSAQVNFLVSLLLNFWQIGTVVYDPADQQIELTFFSKVSLENEFDKLKRKILSHLIAHRKLLVLKSKFKHSLTLDLVEEHGIVKIILSRKLDSFFVKEVTIAIELIDQFLGSNLLVDADNENAIDWIKFTDFEELIFEALQEQNNHKLIGIRSHDRVAIYASK